MENQNKEVTVDQFRKWWFKKGQPMRPPFKDPLFFTDHLFAMCLFRHKQFQVILNIVKPDVIVPKHSHPHVDSCAVYLTGHLQLGLEHEDYNTTEQWSYKQQANPETGMHMLYGLSSSEGYTGEPHGLKSKDGGGAFLVFEKWHNEEPKTVLTDWIGEPIDEAHKRMLDEHKKV